MSSADAPDGALRLVYFHRLHVSGSGQTIQVLRDYHALLAHGERVDVFYRAPRVLSEEQLRGWLAQHHLAADPRFRLHHISEAPGGGKRLRREVRRLIQASPEPVVLVVRTLDHARQALALRRRFKHPRVVMELHETALPHFVYREQGRWLKAWWSRLRERRIFAALDGLVCTVGSQLALLDEVFPDHARAIVLPNGADLSLFAAAPSREPDGRFHLRYAGQFSAWKNTEIMLAALARLPPQVVLDIAGGRADAEQAAREQLAAAAARHGVAGRVNYLGFLPPRDVPAFLQGADALLLPLGDNVQSRHFTSPMKLFEYAASGVPMIVTRQPTTLSLVADGEEALMVAPGSVEDLARAVHALMAEPQLAARLSQAARAWVAQYSYTARANRYNQFLKRLFA